jgi:hypothetical protein
MSDYWQRVENGLLYNVRRSDMAGDKPKWLDGCCRELGMVG